MPVVTFRYTEEYCLEAFHRLISQLARQRVWQVYRLVIVPLAIVAGVYLVTSNGWATLVIGVPAAAVVTVLVYFASKWWQDWLALRSFRKMPLYDQVTRMDFGEDGIYTTNAVATANLDWAVYTKVVHFRDGFLLFQGPLLATWIPVRCLEDAAAMAELEGLLDANIAEHRGVEPVSWKKPAWGWD